MSEPTSSRRLKGPALFSPLLKEDESEKEKDKDKGKDKEKGRDVEGEKIKLQINDEKYLFCYTYLSICKWEELALYTYIPDWDSREK